MKPEQLLTSEYPWVRELGRLFLSNPRYQILLDSKLEISAFSALGGFSSPEIFNLCFWDQSFGLQQFALGVNRDGSYLLMLEYVERRFIQIPHPRWEKLTLPEVLNILLYRDQFYPEIGESWDLNIY